MRLRVKSVGSESGCLPLFISPLDSPHHGLRSLLSSFSFALSRSHVERCFLSSAFIPRRRFSRAVFLHLVVPGFRFSHCFCPSFLSPPLSISMVPHRPFHTASATTIRFNWRELVHTLQDIRPVHSPRIVSYCKITTSFDFPVTAQRMNIDTSRYLSILSLTALFFSPFIA